MRGNGERIGPQNLPTSSIAGGIWNLLNQQRAQQRGAWPSATPAVVTDPYFMYVPLLLNTTSTNGQQNNTFLDSSTNNFTITRNGTPTQGAFTPYQPSGYWSGYFNGSTDYITAPNNTALDLDTGDFTIECWFYIAGNSANNPGSLATAQLISKYQDTSNYWALYLNGTSGNTGTGITFEIVVGGAFTSSTYTGTISQNTWHHIAICRSGSGSNNLSYFLDGNRVQQSTNTRNGANTGTLRIAYFGYSGGYNHYFNGYISNARILKGTPAYSGATYTVPTTPLTAITNTSLLTLQSNRFIDNSSNNFAITANGTPKVQAFQPFSPAASYSAATYGGSGYFNGTTDYLTAASNAAFRLETNTTWTWETWVYPTALNAAMVLSGNTTNGSSNGHSIYLASGLLRIIQFGVSNFASSATAKLNQWNHLAIVCNSGTATFYLNGTSSGSISWGSGTAGGTLFVGSYLGADLFPGWISGTRYQLGVAQVPPAGGPTSPVTATANTSLLLGYTNAGIYDAAWQNNALTVGDAQVSTTQAQWSPTSMKFDGTGDGLKGTVTTNVTPVSGDFTWEGWVYFNTLASAQCLIGVGNSADRTILYFDNSTGLTYVVARSGANQILASQGSTSGWATSTWYYFALTRSGNVYTVYRNGTSIATTTSSYAQSDLSQPITAGYSDWSTSNLTLNGYLQDLRITKGVARTITTPTAAFPTR